MTPASPPAARLLILGTVRSVQVGRAQKLGTPGAADPLQRPWRSAFFKEPVDGAVDVGPLGLAGDEQADRKHHGGPNMAVLMYSADHFPAWRSDHGLEGLTGGGFGENLTVNGFAEEDVCIGDRLNVGSVVLEVSQPRQPCSNINRRWQRKGITEAVTQNGRGGWYLRVLEPGRLSAGDEVLLVDRPNPGLTVKLATDAFYRHRRDPNLLTSLIACPQLSERFKEGLRSRLEEVGG